MAGKQSAEEKKSIQKEMKALLPLILLQFGSGSLLAFGALYGLYYHCDCIPVPKSNEFTDKLIYYIRCCLFPSSILLLYAIIGVINKRGKTGAANPLAGRDHMLLMEKNFLMNTLEQMALFFIVGLTLTTYLSAPEMRALPIYAIVWILGRVLFRIGYGINPKYRTFGMSCTIAATSTFLVLIFYLMYTRGLMYKLSGEVLGSKEASTPAPKGEL